MTRGHGWSLTITMWGTSTPYSLPAFTGAFDLAPYCLQFSSKRRRFPGQCTTAICNLIL
jgi:hypothetical protein